MADNLEIRTNSLELYPEIIRTLPVDPQWLDISMCANGIRGFNKYDQEERERYLLECVEHGVIPHSSLDLVYNSLTGLFIPSDSKMINVPRLNLPAGKIKGIVDSILQGGRLYRINLEVEMPAAEGFRFLKEEFLDTLLGKEYQIEGGNLCLSSWHGKGYGEGEHWAGGLRLRELSYGQVLVEPGWGYVGNDISKERKVADWLRNLKEKYSSD